MVNYEIICQKRKYGYSMPHFNNRMYIILIGWVCKVLNYYLFVTGLGVWDMCRFWGGFHGCRCDTGIAL